MELTAVKTEKKVTKYDDTRGALEMQRLSGAAMFTKPTTVKNVEPVKGWAETFVVETARSDKGDTIFVECVDERNVVQRMALPPKVADAIARQRFGLSKRSRSTRAKLVARERADRARAEGRVYNPFKKVGA